MTRARKTKAQGASTSRDASPTLRDEEELGAGGGQLVDPPAGQQQGEVAVVEQPVDNSMLAMMRDMLQQQNELMQRQMRTEREETVRRVENMLEPFRRQQQQPGQLSHRQQLQLQLEREQRELQLRYEQQLAELPPEEGQMGAGLPPPPPPPQLPAAVGAAAAAAATPPGARGGVVDGRYQPSRPAGQSLPAVCVGDPVREYARFRAEGVDLDKSNVASGGLRPNNWMLPNSTFTVDSLDKKLDSFVTNHPAYDVEKERFGQYHEELRLSMKEARIQPLYDSNKQPIGSEMHRCAKWLLYRVYKKSPYTGSKLTGLHPGSDKCAPMSFAQYEAEVRKKYEDPTDLITMQANFTEYRQGKHQAVVDYFDEKWSRYAELYAELLPDPDAPPAKVLILFRDALMQGLANSGVQRAFQDADPTRYQSLDAMRKHLNELTASEYQRMRRDESSAATYKGLYSAGRAGPWSKTAAAKPAKSTEDVGAVDGGGYGAPRPSGRPGGGAYAPGGRAVQHQARIISGPDKGRMGRYRPDRVLATSSQRADAKLRCFDCGGEHFKGDVACTQPGAKLHRNAPAVRRTVLQSPAKARGNGDVVNMLVYVPEDDVEVLHEDEYVLQLHHEVEYEDEGDFLGEGQAAHSAE